MNPPGCAATAALAAGTVVETSAAARCRDLAAAKPATRPRHMVPQILREDFVFIDRSSPLGTRRRADALAPFEKQVSGLAPATGSGLAATPAARHVPLTCHLTVISRTMLSENKSRHSLAIMVRP